MTRTLNSIVIDTMTHSVMPGTRGILIEGGIHGRQARTLWCGKLVSSQSIGPNAAVLNSADMNLFPTPHLDHVQLVTTGVGERESTGVERAKTPMRLVS